MRRVQASAAVVLLLGAVAGCSGSKGHSGAEASPSHRGPIPRPTGPGPQHGSLNITATGAVNRTVAVGNVECTQFRTPQKVLDEWYNFNAPLNGPLFRVSLETANGKPVALLMVSEGAQWYGYKQVSQLSGLTVQKQKAVTFNTDLPALGKNSGTVHLRGSINCH